MSLSLHSAKARVHYAKKQYPMALDIYQHVLTLRPYSKPDVRVGIGLCFQKLGMRDKARRAFLRAIELDPQNIGARVLLATSLLNSARDALLSGENPEDAASEGEGLVRSAMQQLQEAYMARPHHATLLLLLSDRFFYRDELDKAKAVAQEAVAMADTPAFQAEAYYQVGRCAHKLGQYDQAYEMYSAVLGLNPRHVRARFGFGQMEIHKGLWASAVSTIESLLERFPQCVEIMQALGYIHSQLPKQEGQALEFYERAIKCVADDIKSVPAQPDSSKQQPEKHEMPFSGLLDAASQGLVTDPDFFLEAAALFEPTNITKSYQSYRIAERILERQGKDQSPIPELHNNIGALACLQDSVGDAYTKLSRAVESCRALLLKFEGRDDRADKENPPPVSFANLTRDQKRLESTLTTSMYNLARLYECIGKWTEAEDLYKRILSRHSHYIDAHLRIAYMEQGIHRRVQDAVDAYNDALSLDTSRIATRLLLGNLQLETKQVQAGRRTFEYVLKQLHKHDIYSLCSLGNFYLSAGRSELSQLSVFIAAHGATVSDKKIQHQQKKYQSLAKEHYSKAITFFTTCLKVDEKCVAAAQGLAVAMAENGKFAESRDLLIQVREAIMKGTSAPSITEAQRHLHQLPHMARQIDVNMHVKKDRVLWATLDLAHVYTELGQFRSAVL
ncbi:protein required for normal CLN1 and CLN2 G1 cyclin expression, partial [Spiromyces aspiralis]